MRKLPPPFDESVLIDWLGVLFDHNPRFRGFLTDDQQRFAAARLEHGLLEAAAAVAHIGELEVEVARLRTMVATLVDCLAEHGAVDMQILAARIADALAKAEGKEPPAGPTAGPYR
jgi:hypothetical protein